MKQYSESNNKILFCIALECVLFSTHYIIYLEALNLPDIVYLCEIPPFNYLLAEDSEWTLSHILSGLFAMASVSAPIILWGVILRENLLYNYREYFYDKANWLIFGALILIYFVVICLEIAAFSTFLSQILENFNGGGFGSSINKSSSKLLDIAQENGTTFISLGTGVLILINAMLAWATSNTYYSMNNRTGGNLIL